MCPYFHILDLDVNCSSKETVIGTFKLLRQSILKAFGAGPQDTGAARGAFGPGAGLAAACASFASQRQQIQELFGEARKNAY